MGKVEASFSYTQWLLLSKRFSIRRVEIWRTELVQKLGLLVWKPRSLPGTAKGVTQDREAGPDNDQSGKVLSEKGGTL